MIVYEKCIRSCIYLCQNEAKGMDIIMKVLLFGEFSGLYKNLNDGLHEIGIDVTWASNGDVWKKISGADIEVYPSGYNLFTKAYNYLFFPLIDKRLQGYDIVQAVTPMIYLWQINELAMKRIFKNNSKIFINAAGADCFQYRAYLAGRYKYHIYDENPELIKMFDGKSLRSKFVVHSIEKLYQQADGIIPVVPYDYEVPFEGMNNLKKTILFPINYRKIKYTENRILNKIVFFHGVSRSTEKGSPFIIQAMKTIEKRYPNDVECIIAEKMPYDEYLKAISKANIIIDQCKGYGYGMNACISLAMGKLVMSGAEPEFMKAGNLYDCPINNITPDTNQIIEQMEGIIENRRKIPEIGRNGREYIMEHHDYIKIAEQYMEEWRK